MNPSGEQSFEEIHENLYNHALTRNWPEVIKIYEQHPEIHTAKINRSGDTALHIAIFDGQAAVVEELVRIVAKNSDALKIQNDLGNTPLHLASYLGQVRMCHCIALQNTELMGIRNKYKETPLFLAARHGRKDVFLCLHSLCREPEKRYNYCRRDKGETILHSAISGEHFDLAFQIIKFYPMLQHWVDEDGFSPLHYLASKPSAFRSGGCLRGLHKLIYHCIYVKKLYLGDIRSQGRRDEDHAENSQASFGLFRWLRNITRALLDHNVQETDAEDPNGQQPHHEQVDHNVQETDAEDPNGQQPHHEQVGSSKILRRLNGGLKSTFKAMLEFLSGSMQITKIREEKKKHRWSVQIVDLLLRYEFEHRSSSHLFQHNIDGTSVEDLKNADESMFDYGDRDRSPLADNSNKEEQNRRTNGKGKNDKKETPLLIAAKHGIIEMVEKILEKFPVAIHDMNSDEKNIVLLAVEHKQPHVYEFLLNHTILRDTIFYRRDKNGNSALHLAAKLDRNKQQWLIPGPALQMQWEIKWYKFVENSMPSNFFVQHNNEGKTAWEIFSEDHANLVKDASKWLINTSQSCSIVATLIATVAFTASATIPGGVRSESGTPILEHQPAFSIFAISTLLALCFSVSSVVMFMVFFTSRYHEKDFARDLPAKLLVELTSLLISIAAVLVSFCAAHFFMIKDNLKGSALPLYAATCLPVLFYAVWQFPMFLDIAVATLKKPPQRIYA